MGQFGFGSRTSLYNAVVREESLPPERRAYPRIADFLLMCIGSGLPTILIQSAKRYGVQSQINRVQNRQNLGWQNATEKLQELFRAFCRRTLEMSSRIERRTRRFRMPIVASLAIGGVVAVAVAQDMRFQTATITRNQSGSLSGGSQILPDGKVILTNAAVRDMLHVVYEVADFAIIGAPEWLASERFDIMAQAAENTSRDGLKQMMRKLLAEQFKLVVHQEARSLPVFELRKSHTDGTLGPNMIPAKTSCEICGTAACPHDVTGGSFTAVAMPIGRIVLTLAEVAGRPVIDKTNLSGLYDVKLTWTPGRSTFRAAVRDQLGLELEPLNEPAQVLVIDSVQRLKAQ